MTSAIDSKQFRAALGAFATGVTVVTAHDGQGRDVGLTANSFNSVSLDPPMVLWSLGKSSSSFDAFMETEHFAVHILASSQEDLSSRFARKGTDRFAGLDCARGIGDIPLLDGCSARFECRTAVRHDSGDHVIIVGEVLSFTSLPQPPLVFHGGKYGLLMKRAAGEAEPARIGEDWLGFLLRRAYNQLLWPLRAEFLNNGLDSVHYSILSILAMGDGRPIDQLKSLLEIVGLPANTDYVQDLVTHGLVELRPGQDGEHVHFTNKGRARAIELIVAEKAAENHAVAGLDYQEVALLKDLLRRVIQSTEVGIPSTWHRDQVWLENNLWGQGVYSPNELVLASHQS